MKMKILIAYDGSSHSDAALKDLFRAGLPREAEVIILSLAGHRMALAASASFNVLGAAAHNPSLLRHVEEQAIHDARAKAVAAAEFIKSAFPGWELASECDAGSPVPRILSDAEAWKPDLIVVGSHGRSALGRFFLGSVSQAIVKEAPCSVRVGRARDTETNGPTRLIIGVDASAGSEAALAAVERRAWPRGCEVRILSAINLMATPIPQEYLARKAEAAARRLRSAGLDSSVTLRVGQAADVLIDEAEKWEADCIFVGARGLGPLGRFFLGSTSATVASKAGCSVEVVRGEGLV
ncbi:MAG TPA: universal stress protein [Blastocatellia bacterium]|nr:universal stress protein [Blastocatellia bacterium]